MEPDVQNQEENKSLLVEDMTLLQLRDSDDITLKVQMLELLKQRYPRAAKVTIMSNINKDETVITVKY